MSMKMLRTTIVAAAVSSCVLPAFAAETAASKAANNKLMIVNGNSGRVIYDDGRNDLYCVTRRHVVGYNQYGDPVRRRSMRCR